MDVTFISPLLYSEFPLVHIFELHSIAGWHPLAHYSMLAKWTLFYVLHLFVAPGLQCSSYAILSSERRFQGIPRGMCSTIFPIILRPSVFLDCQLFRATKYRPSYKTWALHEPFLIGPHRTIRDALFSFFLAKFCCTTITFCIYMQGLHPMHFSHAVENCLLSRLHTI